MNEFYHSFIVEHKIQLLNWGDIERMKCNKYSLQQLLFINNGRKSSLLHRDMNSSSTASPTQWERYEVAK